jgi:hypothetical protein
MAENQVEAIKEAVRESKEAAHAATANTIAHVPFISETPFTNVPQPQTTINTNAVETTVMEAPKENNTAEMVDKHTFQLYRESQKVTVLGVEYTIIYSHDTDKYPILQDHDGYVDYHTHTIFVMDRFECGATDTNWVIVYANQIVRHELVHAFLYESGLHSNATVCDRSWPNNEEMIDWIAIQAPKLFVAFTEIDVL